MQTKHSRSEDRMNECLLRQLPPLSTYPDLQSTQVGVCAPLTVSIVHLLQPSPHATPHAHIIIIIIIIIKNMSKAPIEQLVTKRRYTSKLLTCLVMAQLRHETQM